MLNLYTRSNPMSHSGICVWNTVTGSLLHRIHADKDQGKPLLIWSIKFLKVDEFSPSRCTFAHTARNRMQRLSAPTQRALYRCVLGQACKQRRINSLLLVLEQRVRDTEASHHYARSGCIVLGDERGERCDFCVRC